MKGVTPIIAIILLLLITISIVGFTFVWFNRFSQNLTDRTGDSLDKQTNLLKKQIRIDEVTKNSIFLRNVGSSDIKFEELLITIGDTDINLNDECTGNKTISAGVIKKCSFSEQTCNTGEKIRIIAPGNDDEINCP